METFLSLDGTIAKYVHDDGSETSIKTWPKDMESCGGSGRDKFNVFASSSVGCQIKCGFCFLTAKSFPYQELSAIDRANNVIDAIKAELVRRPELKKVPFNLSWMGMGDAWFSLHDTYVATVFIIDNIIELVDQIEGVDIATAMPQLAWDDIKYLKAIDNYLIATGKLAPRPETRTNVRVFYSLHSMDNEIRRKLIPRTVNVYAALAHLDDISHEFNVIYHVVFLDGYNDSVDQIWKLVDLFMMGDKQLRILRYNKCETSKFEESKSFIKIIEALNEELLPDTLKIQLSPGSEVSAACGMFLMRNTNEIAACSKN